MAFFVCSMQRHMVDAVAFAASARKPPNPMKHRSFAPASLLALLAFSLTNPLALAEEGGAGHYLPGNAVTLADLPPTQPGWAFEVIGVGYQGDVAGTRHLPVSGLLAAGLSVRTEGVSIGGFYTLENKILGSNFTIGLFAPYSWVDVDSEVVTPTATEFRSDSNDGFGDISIIPAMMAWKLDCWQLNAATTVFAPTGKYNAGRLANPGLNHWTFDETLSAAYSNEENGFNFAAYAGFSFSTENHATDYKNGVVFHLDSSVQQLFPVGKNFFGVGIAGFYREQITGDSGRGATLGDLESRTVGLGPVLTFIGADNRFIAEVSWLPQFDARHTLKGDYVWIKAVYQF